MGIYRKVVAIRIFLFQLVKNASRVRHGYIQWLSGSHNVKDVVVVQQFQLSLTQIHMKEWQFCARFVLVVLPLLFNQLQQIFIAQRAIGVISKALSLHPKKELNFS